MRYKHRLLLSQIHLSICSSVNPTIMIIFGTIATLQIISIVTHPQSNFFLIFFWADPSNYLPSILFVVLGMLILSLNFGVIITLYLTSEKDYSARNQNIERSNFGSFISIIQQSTRTLIFPPLLKGLALQMKNGQNFGIAFLAGIEFSMLLLLLYPTLLYSAFCNNAISSPNKANLRLFNIEFLLAIFVPIFTISSVLNQQLSNVISGVFIILFLFSIVKTPTVGYSLNNFRISFPSAVFAACVIRICSEITSNSSENFVSELLILFGLISSILFISRVLTKKLLQSQLQQIQQLKTLLYLIGNMDSLRGDLVHFLFNHSIGCQNPYCSCSKLRQCFLKEKCLPNDKDWYNFLISLINWHFDLKKMRSLPLSQMKDKTQKYREIVFDLAQIYLFKLNNIYQSWKILNDYQTHLNSHNLSRLWSDHRAKIVFYHLQRILYARFCKKKGVNLKANIFLDFQDEFQSFFDLCMITGNQVSEFWEQMTKFKTNQSLLQSHLEELYQSHLQLKLIHQNMVFNFLPAKQIIDAMMSDYCQQILLASPGQSCHFVEVSDSKKQNQERITRLNQDTDCFSFDSQTPMCLVSAEKESLGKILKSNIFFNEAQKLLGKVDSIKEFLPPQLRQNHSTSMLKRIENEQMTIPHQFGFIYVCKDKQLLSVKILIQIVPSILEDLRYAIFFKRINPSLALLAVHNCSQILYSSKAFDENIYLVSIKELILKTLGQKEKKILKIGHKFVQKFYQIFILHKYEKNDEQIIFIQIKINDESRDKSIFKNITEKTSNKKKSMFFQHQLVIQKDNRSLVRKKQKKYEQNLIDEETFKEMKLDQNIKYTFQIFFDENSGGKIRTQIYGLVIVVIVVMVALLAWIINNKKIEQTNIQQIYYTIMNYNDFMMSVVNTSISLKQINLASYQDQSFQNYYKQLQAAPNLYQIMKKILQDFDQQVISEVWINLQLNQLGIFTNGSAQYVKFVPDYLQMPLINLQTTPSSDFNFSFSKDYLTSPLTSTQRHFHTFMTNALYIALPNFRSLWGQKLFPKLKDSICPSIIFIVVTNLIVLAVFIGQFRMFFIHRRVVAIKQMSQRILQILNPLIIAEKSKKCQNFLKKYNFKIHKSNRKKGNPSSIVCLSQQQIQNTSKNIRREADEIEKYSEQIITRTQQKIMEEISAQSQNEEQKAIYPRRKRQIFSKTSRLKIFLFYFAIGTAFITFSLLFCCQEINIKSHIKKQIQSTYGGCYLQQSLSFIHLYALHFGVYDSQLQGYLNIGKQLMSDILGMIYIVQELINTFQDNNYHPSETMKYLLNIRYDNFCQIQSSGVFSSVPYQFEGRGNMTYCQSIHHGVLTKGFIAAMLSYVQSANNLFISNQHTVMHSQTEKLAYLSNPFFTDTVIIRNYLNLMLEYAWQKTQVHFMEQLQAQTNFFVYSSIVLIVMSVIFIVLLPKMFIFIIEKQSHKAKSIFTLISQTTIVNDEKLKQVFVRKIDMINELK